MKQLFILFAVAAMAAFLCLSCSKNTDKLVSTEFRNASIEAADIQLTTSADTIVADGKTYVEVRLRVAPNILLHHKSATFKISAPGKFSDGTDTINTTIDNNGEATVFALSATEGVVYIKSTIDTFRRTVLVRFIKDNPNKLYLLRDSVAADNFAYAEIVMVTDKTNFASAGDQITFSADNGLFSNNSGTFPIQRPSNDTARAFLKHDKAGLVNVKVTTGALIRQIQVHFVPAVPDMVVIDPDSPIIQSALGATTKITATLTRHFGSVSDGQTVYFRDITEPMGTSIGVFLNSSISRGGTATTNFVIQDTSFHGYLRIEGYLLKNNRIDTVSGSKRILIQ